MPRSINMIKQNSIKTKKSVSVVIPAYNEAQNIKTLIQSIINQSDNNFSLIEIIIASDGSTDDTINEIKKVKDKRISIINGTKREGQSSRLTQLFKQARGDVIVLIDADIHLTSARTLDYLIHPFSLDRKIGLVGANRKPYKAKTFVEESLQTSIRAYDNIAMSLRNGSNPYNCHGSALALSKEFAKRLEMPKNIFSTDTYLYFSCLNLKFKFFFSKKAVVRVHIANNLKDAILQYKRFLAIDSYSKRKFKNLLEREYQLPKKLRYKSIIKEFINKPIHCFAMFIIMTYSRFNSASEAKAVWTIANSTKRGIND